MRRAISALKRGLEALNTHLASNTYLVGHSVTLADIITVCNLNLGFSTVMTKSFTSAFPHVERYFWTLINQPNFKKVVGDVKQTESVPAIKKAGQPAKPKEQPKKKEAPAAEATKVVEEEEAPKPKAKNPLDLLPPSPMVLDEWKRLYSNTKSNFREVAIKGFWDMYDPEGYSLWFCDYKYNDENMVSFVTLNKVGGFLQRMDLARKYAFGKMLICGSEGPFKVKGLWLFRGPEIPKFVMDEVYDMELYEWTKVDISDEAQKERVSRERASFVHGCLKQSNRRVNMGTVLNLVNPPNTTPCLLSPSNKIPWTKPFLSGVFIARPITPVQRCHVVRRSRVSASLLGNLGRLKRNLQDVTSMNYWVVRDYYRLVDSVNSIERQIQSLSDEQLKAKTLEFRERLARGESLADLQAEAFAVVREAAKRTIGMRHFDVQIIGGGVLHDGSIAEMKTGEGKTLVSTLAAYLNALTGEGVHVVTVNDYLAQRDAEWMGRVHRFLGLSVGLIQRGMKAEERKFNYGCDITYTNNSELGFDYLRDNLTSNSEQLVMRWPKPFHFAIVDEVDSVLIDEGRNPLLISGEANENAARYPVAAKVAELLVKDIHYKVELKENSVELTEEGISLAEMALETGDLWDENDPWARFVMNALKAKEFYKRDVQYIVRNGKALIINELTGRVEEKRRWSEGVHQAVEAKEGLEIQADSIVVAQITYQSLFKLYPKLSGMTGTAKTEEKEFLKMFQIPVIEVPTNLSNIRIDLPIQAFATARGKWEYVRREVEDMFGQGRPVLVGTTSVENSEYLSALLKEWGIPHNVLNARPKYAAREADFIAQAGRKYAITISTNMAGRGTDIILGGNPKMLAREIIEDSILSYLTSEVLADDIDDNELSQKVLSKIKVGPSSLALLARASLMAKYVGKSESKSWSRKKAKSVVTESLEKSQTMDPMELQNLVNEQSEMYPLGPAIALAYLSVLKDCEAHCLYEGSEVKRLGGLHVIGTSLHESRRIDNQLRGRAGRQGDPGSTRFMVSLQDEMFQKFNFDTEWAVRLISKITNDEDLPIEGDTIVKQLLALQINAEKYFFGIRKSLVEFDEVLEVQRKHVYDLRQLLLTGDNESCSQHIYQYMQAVVDEIVVGNSDPHKHPRNWNLAKLLKEFMAISGNLLDDSFSGITERTMLQSLENLHETSSIDMDNFHLPNLPKPPNAFRGIRRKNASLRRWLDICSDDLTGSGRYRTSINLLRKFLGDYLIASYLSAVQESGFDDGYVKEIERAVLLKTLDCFWRDHLVNMNKLSSAVNVRSFAHRNPLEEYKIDGCRFFISMLSATRRLTIESILQYWSSPMESQELFVS